MTYGDKTTGRSESSDVAARLISALSGIFEQSAQKLAGLCAADGRLEPRLLDVWQPASYQLAWASGELLAAKTLLAQPPEELDDLHARIGLVFVVDAITSIAGRLESIRLDVGADVTALHGIVTCGDFAALRQDVVGGAALANELLAAERYRRRHGKGQHVKLALEDVALAMMGHLGFIAEAQYGARRERAGNYLYGAFGRDFSLGDGARVIIVGLTAKQWQPLCVATGLDEALHGLESSLGLDFQRGGHRFQARKEIAALFEVWFAGQRLSDVRRLFDQHGVCWNHYQTVAELVDGDPDCSVQNPMFTMVDQYSAGALLAAGLPFEFSGIDRIPAVPAPVLGQHTEEVLYDLLRINAAMFGRLHDRGVVGTADQQRR
jgi:hypothetical protein